MNGEAESTAPPLPEDGAPEVATGQKNYDQNDWYWQVGERPGELWSARSGEWVAAAEADKWRATGGVPAYVQTERQLEDVLQSQGLIGPISAFPTPELVVETFRAAIQQHVDAQAQSRRYDSGNSLASYVASTNEAWAAEAQAFVAWRDAVWQHAYVELDRVVAGEREQPGVEAFIGELPVIEWPA